MVSRLGRVPARPPASRCSSTPSTSSTATRHNPEFALRVLRAAHEAGATRLVLCDTNGGTLPHDVEQIVAEVRAALPDAGLGAHFHNDTGCAVANALAAVRQGAVQVQGCINGYGERTGNANLTDDHPQPHAEDGDRDGAPRPARAADPGVAPHRRARQPHTRPAVALRRHQRLRPQGRAAHQRHRPGPATPTSTSTPDAIGNLTRFVVSEMAGRSTVAMRAKELGLDLPDDHGHRRPRAAEDAGARRLPLRGGRRFLRAAAADAPPAGSRTSSRWRASGSSWRSRPTARSPPRPPSSSRPGASAIIATAEGNGPVNALDQALRQAIGQAHPALAGIHLTDYKVRVLDTHKGTGAVTRVLLDSADEERSWSTIGVSENIIEASWQALSDSIVHGLLAAETPEASGELPGRVAFRAYGRRSVRPHPSGGRAAPFGGHPAGGGVAGGPARRPRPGRRVRAATGVLFGTPGPDSGYALTLAERFHDRITAAFPETVHDAESIAAQVAMRRGGVFGRAPIERRRRDRLDAVRLAGRRPGRARRVAPPGGRRRSATTTPAGSGWSRPSPTWVIRQTTRPGPGGRAGRLAAPAGPRSARERRPGPVRAVPDGLPPRRRRPHRPVQLALRPPRRRHVRAADRGHRRRAVPAGVDRGHPDDPAVAGPRLGRGPVPPVGAVRPPPRRRPSSCWTSGAAYECFCTEEEITARYEVRKAAGPADPGYDGHCRDLSRRASGPGWRGRGGPGRSGSGRPTRV